MVRRRIVEPCRAESTLYGGRETAPLSTSAIPSSVENTSLRWGPSVLDEVRRAIGGFFGRCRPRSGPSIGERTCWVPAREWERSWSPRRWVETDADAEAEADGGGGV